MTDRELLEDAAKAGGYWNDFALDEDGQPIFDEVRGFQLGFGRGWWHAGNDDGDALRLAVKFGMEIDPSNGTAWARAANSPGVGSVEHLDPDPYAATRRAIVRAAAAIGAAK